MKLYRAASDAECEQVLRTGRLEIISQSIEGKWFAESVEDARAWGRWFSGVTGVGHDRMIVVEISDVAASGLFRLARLDGIGPARFAFVNEFGLFVVHEVTK